MSSVIFVSLRMAASVEAPSSPMLLFPRLRARGRVGNGERIGVSMGADRGSQTLGGSGSLEFGDRRLLEDGGERRGALEPDPVPIETASEGQSRELRKRRVNGR